MLARRFALGLLAALSAGVLHSTAEAQEDPAPRGRITTAALVQGEAKTIPADFFAQLEESRLQLQLQDFGVAADQGGLEDTLVTLITPSGDTRRAQSDATGRVMFEGVQPGPVGLVVAGPNRHASVAVYAQQRQADAPREAFTLPVMHANPGEVMKHTAGYASGGQADPFTPADYDGFARSDTVLVNYYQVSVQPDGALQGRVFTVVDPDVPANYAATNVTLYRGGQEVARAVSDPSGTFAFPNVTPGSYGLIAAGPAGYGAFGFEVVPAAAGAQALPQPATASFRQVSMQPAPPMVPAGQLYVPMLPPAMLPALSDVLQSAYGFGPEVVTPFGPPLPIGPPMAPMGGFPAGGGMAGGGGFAGGGGAGGGGIGGLGGIAGLAALGGIAAIIASENDDEPFVVPGEVSPNNVQ